jgi:hypothetical protein
MALAETTPIFDEMVSAWFRAVTERPKEPEPWRFDADAGFDAARAVSRAEPGDFTDSGLPRRNPRQHLVPGSAPRGPPRHGIVADDVRDRLSSYRQGVRRARDEHWETGAGWRFASDVGWRAANAVPTSTPVTFTAGGLPPRAADSGRAEELRGRLGNFQKGLSQGRRNLAERAAANGVPKNEQQERE